MNSRFHFVWGLVLVAVLPHAALGQRIELPSSPPKSPPDASEATSTAISAGMSGVGEIPGAVDKVARGSSSGWRQYIKKGKDAAGRAARYQERRAFMSATSQAKRIGPFVKPLGPLAFVADTVASMAGSFSVGDCEGAAVTGIDEAGEFLAGMGGAALAGSLAGSALGPLGTVGGALWGIAGAFGSTLIYDVYVSPTVRETAEEYMSDPEKEFFLNRTEIALMESDENFSLPLDDYTVHMVQKLAQELRARDALAAAAADSPLGPVIMPPAVDAQGRKRCQYCGDYH